MRILKSHPLASLINGYLVDSPQPSNVSYLWSFGSLLAFCLVIQIVTGVTLAMHYNPSVLEAFNSVEHIMRDVNNEWLIRYLHSNTASAFFFLYLHIGKGLYYGSYRATKTLILTRRTFMLLVADLYQEKALSEQSKRYTIVFFSILGFVSWIYYICSVGLAADVAIQVNNKLSFFGTTGFYLSALAFAIFAFEYISMHYMCTSWLCRMFVKFISFRTYYYIITSLLMIIFSYNPDSFIGIIACAILHNYTYFIYVMMLTYIVLSLEKIDIKNVVFSVIFYTICFVFMVWFFGSLFELIGIFFIHLQAMDIFPARLHMNPFNSGNPTTSYNSTGYNSNPQPNPNSNVIIGPSNSSDYDKSSDAGSIAPDSYSADYSQGDIPYVKTDKGVSEPINFYKPSGKNAIPISKITAYPLEKIDQELDLDNVWKIDPTHAKRKGSSSYELLEESSKSTSEERESFKDLLKKEGLGTEKYIRYDAKTALPLGPVTRASLANIPSSKTAEFDMGSLKKVFIDKNFFSEVFNATWEKQMCMVLSEGASEDETSALWNQFIGTIFTTKKGYIVGPENKSGKGRVDVLIKYSNPSISIHNVPDLTKVFRAFCHVEYKSLDGDHWFNQVGQISEYVDKNKLNVDTFSACIRGHYVAFFMSDLDFHSKYGFDLKGVSYDGMLGLFVDKSGVRILPQSNTHHPQMYMYDIRNPDDLLPIYTIFKFMSILQESPILSELRASQDKENLFFTTKPHESRAFIGTIGNTTEKLYIKGNGEYFREKPDVISKLPANIKF